MAQTKKREVNGFLKQVLEVDKAVTKKFVKFANNFLPCRSLKVHYKMLEISCHGVPWFACWIAFIWIAGSANLLQMQINMLLGLITDILLVATIKSVTRRRRPMPNDDDIFGKYGPDKFSFPSGHASRAVFVTYFFINLYPVFIMFYLPLLAWSTAVCLSRVLMYRHHLLDIAGGVLLGLFNGVLISILWLGQDSCNYIYSIMSDEKLEGGSYHV